MAKQNSCDEFSKFCSKYHLQQDLSFDELRKYFTLTAKQKLELSVIELMYSVEQTELVIDSVQTSMYSMHV